MHPTERVSARRSAAGAVAALLVVAAACAPTPPPEPTIRLELRRAELAPGFLLTEATAKVDGQKVYVAATVELDNADVAAANPRKGPSGRPLLELKFTPEGAKKMARLAKEHQRKPVAVMIDGTLLAAPVLIGDISTAAVIDGNFTQEEAARLAQGIRPR